jgi:hypothetical protein
MKITRRDQSPQERVLLASTAKLDLIPTIITRVKHDLGLGGNRYQERGGIGHFGKIVDGIDFGGWPWVGPVQLKEAN